MDVPSASQSARRLPIEGRAFPNSIAEIRLPETPAIAPSLRTLRSCSLRKARSFCAIATHCRAVMSAASLERATTCDVVAGGHVIAMMLLTTAVCAHAASPGRRRSPVGNEPSVVAIETRRNSSVVRPVVVSWAHKRILGRAAHIRCFEHDRSTEPPSPGAARAQGLGSEALILGVPARVSISAADHNPVFMVVGWCDC